MVTGKVSRNLTILNDVRHYFRQIITNYVAYLVDIVLSESFQNFRILREQLVLYLSVFLFVFVE